LSHSSLSSVKYRARRTRKTEIRKSL